MKKTAKDYKFIRLLGEGSFSSVYLAVDTDVTLARLKNLENIKIRKYAIKVCERSHIIRQGKQAAIVREKDIMRILNQHPNQHFISLHTTFKDNDRLYFVMTYAENGDLLTYMQKHPLSLDIVRNYTLQLVSALEHLHKLGIVHRDLKPENILLNDQKNLLITDFGSAQIYTENNGKLENSSDRRNSYVGTAQYVSPEMLENRLATTKSDLWALGVIIFQMITNIMPFNAPNEYLIYQKILNLEYEYPKEFDSKAQDLVSSLVKLEPMERLGATDDLKNEGYSSIRKHNFLCEDPDFLIRPEPRNLEDPDLADIDKINPGLNETRLLQLLTLG